MSKKFKHKKVKNTGLLYELLIRQMTSDVLNNSSPISFKLIKKYFYKGSPLMEELNLYNTLLKYKDKNSDFALKMVDAVVRERSNIDEQKLNSDKYNLVKDIQKKYERDIFLKTQIENYKVLASIYNLFENRESDNPSLYLKNKLQLVKYITNSNSETIEKQDLLEDVDPELKSLTLKLLTEKFNSKWSSNLNEDQKDILRHFIFNSVDSDSTKTFIDNNIQKISKELKSVTESTADAVLKIKLNEVLNILPKISNTNFITETHYVSLIRYYELIKELKS
jgi:hypothetical protein